MNSAATMVPRGEYDGRPLQSPPLLPRASAQAGRLARDIAYDPITLRNAETGVVVGFVGLSIFGVAALMFAGAGETLLAVIEATLATIAAVAFVSAVHIRARQEKFAHIGASAVGEWAIELALVEYGKPDVARAA